MDVDREGPLDPWVAEWLEANSEMMEPPAEYTPEWLEAARLSFCPFPTREMARTTDAVVEGVPVRIYEHDHAPAGLVVYFHGGGFCAGSIAMMENIATELAHAADATVISVEYRLAPEHTYPAALDDCETVTRWAIQNAERFGVSDRHVVVAGESGGGNFAAGVALRLRDDGTFLAAQVLLYPVLDGADADYPSRLTLDSPMLRTAMLPRVFAMYAGDRDLSRDPYALPLRAETLTGLPPAFTLLGGSDPLRDEGRAYADRLRADGVESVELCAVGQPHGFLNLGFPAAAEVYVEIGKWLRPILEGDAAP